MENLLRIKGHNQQIRSNGIAIVVSVNNHSQNNLKKHYDSTNIDWALLERQLHK